MQLGAQTDELIALIADAEADGDIVGEMNFRTRLNAVRAEMTEIIDQDENTAEVAVLFQGEPVHGSERIDARFAALALHYLQNVVTRVFSSKITSDLSPRGRTKGAELAALSITGIATGSFGFILEEADRKQYSTLKTPVRVALEETVSIFEGFTQEDENSFLVDLESVNPRVFNSLSKFFSHLNSNRASLKTGLPDRIVAFDSEGISRAYNRISQTRIQTDLVTWTGTLLGLSPIKRTFDFRRDESGMLTSGKFGQRVSQEYLERIENEGGIMLGAQFEAKIEIITVRKPDGSTSTNYVIDDLEPLPKLD